MANPVEMPKLSDTMEQGVIAKWNVKEGDKVEAGDIIAEVETDKATMEVEVFDGGTILKILADEGDSVPLGQYMAIIGEEGEDISHLLESAGDKGDQQAKQAAGEKSSEQQADSQQTGEKAPDKTGKKSYDPLFGDLDVDKAAQPTETPGTGDDDRGRIKASPLARSMARERGLDLTGVKGSGPSGRIVKRDIEELEKAAPAETSAAATEPAERESQDVRISQMRKTIARRLAESKFTSPHFYETIDLDMKQAIELRQSVNEISEVKISFNDIVVKACALALTKHPQINASWMDDIIRQHGDVHVAVAVAVEEGLLTPVIRHTDQKGLEQISKETRAYAERAREKKLQPEDWEGSTFTVSNLGMYGIEEFTAIINPPNACILAVGAIRDVPVVENGQVVPGKRMKVTLSSDHRIVDGAKAAEFLNTLRNLIERPMGMLL